MGYYSEERAFRLYNSRLITSYIGEFYVIPITSPYSASFHVPQWT
jgi:hypothetical protein